MDRLEEIKSKLNILKSMDTNFDIFGAESHKYEFKSKLTESEIKKYENENKCVVPSEYREFLINIGNGGCGPFYGLFSLYENDNQKVKLEENFEGIKNLRTICDKREKDLNNSKSYESQDEIFEKYDGEIDKLYFESLNGIKILCHEGCGMYCVLSMNGIHKGEVWFFDFSNDIGMYPLFNPKTKKALTFYDWYLLWLDNSISELKNNENNIWEYSKYLSLDEFNS